MKNTKFKLKQSYRIALLIFAVLIANSAVYAAAGDVDPGFNPGLVLTRYESSVLLDNDVREIIIQPDGKAIAIGSFRAADKYVRDAIVRINQDGTIDTTFNPPKFPDFTFQAITAVALQNDGKIIVSLNLDLNVGGVVRRGLARLNADGSLDSTFNILRDAGSDFSGYISDIEVSADNKITFAGRFFNYKIADGSRENIARVLPDGSPDVSFNAQNQFSGRAVSDVELLTADKTLVASRVLASSSPDYLDRLNADGSIDNSFNSSTLTNGATGSSGIDNSIRVQADGKILVGGGFTIVNGFAVPRGLVRFNSDGSFDTSFNTNNAGLSNGNVNDIEVFSDGKILIGGDFQGYNGTTVRNFAVLNSDGTLAGSFAFSGDFIRVNDLAVQADGKIIVGSKAARTTFNGEIQRPIFRLNADASVDESYKPTLGDFGTGRKIFVQADGKILVGGNFSFVDGKFHNGIVRLNPDGTTDEQFKPLFGGEVLAIDRRADGKIVFGTSLQGTVIYNTDGTITRTSANLGYSPDVKFLPNGDILAIGNSYLRKISDTGQIDFSFSVQANSYLRKIALQPDGKILIAGEFTTVGGTNRSRIARLNADGTLDTTFNPVGGANDIINDIALQPDGKIIIGGKFTGVNFDTSHKYLARLNSDGSLDTSFTALPDDEISSLKIQPNGKILIGGIMNTVNGVARKSLARLNSDGSLDTGFNVPAGTDNYIWSIDLQANGNIIIGGNFRYVNNLQRIGVARLFNDEVGGSGNGGGKTLFDYDGDGKADVSVFRSATNLWYELQSGNSQVSVQNFGIDGDVVAPADYDGDGKTDLGIFRPLTGQWWYQSSVDNVQKSVQFGASGDVPRPSDFDGDGKADFVLFRPSNNVWYRLGSTGTVSIVSFGLSGDKPLIGDFDGDGKSDVAIYRPSTGQWWYQSSADNSQRATKFGISTDIPVAADYDGDGKTDFAVYRPSNGVWYILNSSTGQPTIIQFGISEDKPVAADYDGDGKADIAVFRPSTGVWYLLKTSEGFAALQFGISTDVPTPNAFIQR